MKPWGELEVDAQFDFAGGIALQPVQDIGVGLQLGRGVGIEGKILLETIRAGGRLERGKLVVGAGLLHRSGGGHDVAERRILLLGAADELLEQVLRRRRVGLHQGPSDDDENEDEPAQVVVFIHGKSGGSRGVGVARNHFRDGRLGDFKLGIVRAQGKGFFLVFDGDDGAHDAGGGDHFVARFEAGEQFGELLVALLLRPDEGKIHHHPDEHHEHQWALEQTLGRGRTRLRRRGCNGQQTAKTILVHNKKNGRTV